MDAVQLSVLYPLTISVRRLFHKLGHGVSQLHRDAGINGGMRAVLESVISGGPQTVPQMARSRPVSRQHIQGLVNGLLDAGLAEYAPNPAHKRSKLVVATTQGRAAFAAMRERETEAFAQLTLPCTAADLAAADRVLRAVIGVLDSQEWRAIAGDDSQEDTEE